MSFKHATGLINLNMRICLVFLMLLEFQEVQLSIFLDVYIRTRLEDKNNAKQELYLQSEVYELKIFKHFCT